VREGADAGSVEAVFRTEGLVELEAELVARGLEADQHELVVRRTLSRAGRSRAQLAGQLVPVSALGELFSGRIEISSQHDSQRLLRPELHGELLDRSGGLGDLREAVASGFAELRALDRELLELREASRERARRRDFLDFQVREIDAAKLDPAEVEALRTERSRLAHAEQLREEGAAVLGLLAGDPARVQDANAADLLSESARRLEALGRIDAGLAELAGRLVDAQAEVRDAAAELERSLDGIESDPPRLSVVEDRLHEVEGLQRKYGASVEEVLRFRDQAATELSALEGAQEREGEIQRQRESRSAQLAEKAKALSAGRSRAGRKLARVVQGLLRELGMPRARFSVALEPADCPEDAPCGPTGSERPELCFSANTGEPLRPLRRVASGGELSRVFLAIKSALREADAGMVLVFDEVDAAIGGRVADRLGRSLAELAARHQVLCITHLPQIAAFARAHFRVEKRSLRGRTRVRVVRVEGAERIEEIARMAGGESVGEATRRHARELLQLAGAP
jgi:DNA repair protein RecN (Recombination protein N)